ncbi:MAG: hypothetical protein RIT27_705 [Pseudomonadota bacterium]|jgi:general secretion pathway protein D
MIMWIYLALIVWILTGCAPQPLQPSAGHLNTRSETPPPASKIPPPVLHTPYLPPPSSKSPKTELFTVVVDQVPAKELLFALARDAKLNVDIDPRIKGSVTMNAIDQTLSQLLDRIAKQLDLRYQLLDNQLSISLDLPYVQSYKIDYVNMSRDTENRVTVSTQVSTGGNAVSNTSNNATSSAGASSNNSQTALVDISKNHFWETLEKNIQAILLTEERITTTRRKQLKASSKTNDTSVTAKSADVDEEKEEKVIQHNVMTNPESGIISVRATSRQHNEIKAFLEKVTNSVQRQVLIEATIIEVTLNDSYQSGINWQRLGGKFNIIQNFTQTDSNIQPFYGISYADKNSGIGDISAAIKLLESFGNTKVLSSPKIMALNNQTAILKVVDNHVYFTVSVQDSDATTTSARRVTYETQVHTVPEGLIMNITPQISADDNVMLNVRPTISRIIGYKNDPNPALANANVVSQIPIVQVREIESLLKIRSGNIAMIGGLMQNAAKQGTNGIPVASQLPMIGDLFSQRDDQHKKSELIIFLRPLVIKDASIKGDFQNYQPYLPDLNHLETPPDTNLLPPNF